MRGLLRVGVCMRVADGLRTPFCVEGTMPPGGGSGLARLGGSRAYVDRRGFWRVRGRWLNLASVRADS